MRAIAAAADTVLFVAIILQTESIYVNKFDFVIATS